MAITALHKLLAKSQWEEVVELLKNDDTHFMIMEQYKGDLPLHTACERRAPDEVILDLLSLNEKAASRKGRGGCLPLHVATQRSLSADVIEALIRAYPDGLDTKNDAEYTPRDYGHKDSYAYQALGRPTGCWKQVMKDEVREEEQDVELQNLHTKADIDLENLEMSNKKYENMISSLKGLKTKLDECTSLHVEDLEDNVGTMEKNMVGAVDDLENRLCSLEDDTKATCIKDFIAKRAAQAHQNQVTAVQNRNAKEASRLLEDIDEIRMEIEMRKHYEVNRRNTAQTSNVEMSVEEMLATEPLMDTTAAKSEPKDWKDDGTGNLIDLE